MSQLQTIGKTATTIRREEGYTIIRYHSTDVVKFNDKEIILNTGGWETATTKARMNQASHQFNLGYTVYQKDFSWNVAYNGMSREFSGNTIILPMLGQKYDVDLASQNN